MPAVPVLMLAATAVGTAASISASNKQRKAAKQAANLASRQAAVQNQANAQAQANANERDRIAQQVQEDQAASAEQQEAPEVSLIDPAENPTKRRRTVQAQFNLGGEPDGSLRL